LYAGKTFIALDWSLSVATAVPDWMGRKVTPIGSRVVIYIYAEGAKALKNRMRAWKVAHGVSSLDRFYAVPCPLDVRDKLNVDALAEAIQSKVPEMPCLIVIDTLARNFGDGDENQTKDMNQFVAGCDALRTEYFPGCAILIVHHTGKDAKKGGRGNSALYGATDMEFWVRKGLATRPDAFSVRNRKRKDGGTLLHDVSLERFDVAGTGSCALRLSDAPVVEDEDETAASAVSPEAVRLHKVLDSFGEGATLSEWVKASGKSKPTVLKYRAELLGKDLIKPIGEGRGARYICARPRSLGDQCGL
jgi:hypothetical protein